MRFHYVPSTYRGRKFGKGFCGGAYRGCARICGGALDDNLEDTPGPVAVPVNIPVQPAQIQQNLMNFPDITPDMIERARMIIALAEATGKAQPITKKEAGIWSGIKNIGSKVWNATKAVASNPLVQTAASVAAPYLIGAVAPTLASYVPKALDSVGRYAYNKLDPIYHQEAIVNKSAGDNFKEIKDNVAELATKGVSNAVSAVAAAPASIYNSAANIFKSGWNRFWNKSGSGYRGGRRARFRKGSPEAKAYMARLRALRVLKKRSGRGYRGGMLPKGLWGNVGRNPLGWSSVPNFRGSGYMGGMFPGVAYNDLVKLANDADQQGENFVNVNWKDASGNERTTKVSLANIDKMLKATDTIADFYDDKDRQNYIKEHYGKKAWPYKNMTYKRFKKLLSTHRRTQNKWEDVQQYWNDRTENGESDFYKKWMAFNYYYRYDPNNVYSNMLVHGKKNRIDRSLISQVRKIRQKKEGLLNGEIYEDLIPNKFSKVDRESWILKELPKISKKEISEDRKKAKELRAKLKQIEMTKKLNKKKKKAAAVNSLDPVLSPVAAASSVADVSTGPPPAAIMPSDDDDDDDDDDTETDDDVVPVEIATLRNRLDNLIAKASGIANVDAREQIMGDLNVIGSEDLAIVISKYNDKKPWKADATRLRKKLNKITLKITGHLKKRKNSN